MAYETTCGLKVWLYFSYIFTSRHAYTGIFTT